MIHKRQQRGVLVAHRFPIDAVHCGRVKEVAHLPPAFEIDLAPFGVAIQLHVKMFNLVLVILGFELVLWHVDDEVVLVHFQEHFFAVEGDVVVVGVAQHCLFAFVEVVNAQMRFSVSLREQRLFLFAHFISRRAAQVIDAAIVQHPDVSIISRCDLQACDPVLNSVGVHFHRDRFFGFLF